MYFVWMIQLSVPISISVKVGACVASQDTGKMLSADSSYHLSVFIIKVVSPGLNCIRFPFFVDVVFVKKQKTKHTQPIITAVTFEWCGDVQIIKLYISHPLSFYFVLVVT